MQITSLRIRRGFTLIELVVVIAIVAILSAVAAPSFRNLIAAQRVRSAASAITESLWLARSEAIKRNASVSFTLSSSTMSNGWQIVDGATVLHRQDGAPAVALASGGGTITFNPYGRLTAGSGDIGLAIASANVSRCISVATNGRATVRSGSC
jgi:type IV fimbrial biogenesis protein FimT